MIIENLVYTAIAFMGITMWIHILKDLFKESK